MDKALLKRMAGEVSVKTLGGMLVNYAQSIATHNTITNDLLDDIAAIETLIAELKSRGGVTEKKREGKRRKPAEGDNVNGSVHPESGELQREQSEPTGTIRLGNGAVREQL
ncbi:hypothetical protein EV294_11250 [Paenibacillus sp. BK033]|uniref:hypothetical protein n=1 Tax=Paenibacillus sp. BK033 TaxID=2512133 RepID=UPI0010494115|nr:hypothetical protein [Paenibacillus sp. BK033]TCM89585.1 hypothetical protein EV294_11250 [Paenibacillus sp. BK033]